MVIIQATNDRTLRIYLTLKGKNVSLPEILKSVITSLWLESSCNAGDPGSIPVLGRSPGERNGYPPHYSCLGNPWRDEPDIIQP